MFPDLTRDDVFRIETRRLWLRWPCASDAAAIVELAGNEAVSEMTARIPHPLDVGTVDAFVMRARREATEGRSLTMAITPRRQPQTLIGLVSIEPDPTEAGPHLGYWVGAPHWGQGLATEAAAAMVEAFFAYTDGHVLTSGALVENAASRRVLVKAGFGAEGTQMRPFPARGGDRLTERYRLERRTWERRTSEGRATFERRSVVAIHV